VLHTKKNGKMQVSRYRVYKIQILRILQLACFLFINFKSLFLMLRLCWKKNLY